MKICIKSHPIDWNVSEQWFTTEVQCRYLTVNSEFCREKWSHWHDTYRRSIHRYFHIWPPFYWLSAHFSHHGFSFSSFPVQKDSIKPVSSSRSCSSVCLRQFSWVLDYYFCSYRWAFMFRAIEQTKKREEKHKHISMISMKFIWSLSFVQVLF